MDTLDVVFSVLLGALIGLAATVLVTGVAAKKECLEQGFPKYELTWNLDAYCVNIEGAVEGTVKKLEE